ncbi:hypothetical protein [Streptomyces sp. NPDC021096]|uniref:hypothetical protein n=1 Tax=Streptomyces sp. NPDC021096 TaxID=3154792 RepID=UPI00340E8632
MTPLEHVPNNVHAEELRAIGLHMAAVWAAQGHHCAVLSIERSSHQGTFFRQNNSVRWATEPVPTAAPPWTRLRINPTPGEIWGGTHASGVDTLNDTLDQARRLYDRTLLLDLSSRSVLLEQLARYGTPILGRIAGIPMPALTRGVGTPTVLDPAGADQRDRMTSAATALGEILWTRPALEERRGRSHPAFISTTWAPATTARAHAQPGAPHYGGAAYSDALIG